MTNFDNISMTVVCPEIKPFLWVENNKIKSGFKKLEDIVINFPKSTKFYSVSGFEIGLEDEKTGNYSGLLGIVQRGEADSLFHPIPFSMFAKDQFQFSIALYSSGFGTLSLVRYPVQKTNDLTNCFFDFKLDVIFFFLIFYFLIALILAYDFSLKLNESALLVYRIMFKEHNLKLKHLMYRQFLTSVLMYYFLLNIIIEQNVNTNLVVNSNPEYIDTIKQLYENKKLTMHFLKGHFTISYFKNHYENPMLKDIYERVTKKCANCVHDQRDYLPLVYNENEQLLSTPNHLMIIDDPVAIFMRKGACNMNSEWIIRKGIVRSSPIFFQQLFSFLLRKDFSKFILKEIINRKAGKFYESGISLFYESSVKGQIFGFIKNTSPSYEQCKMTNTISTLDNAYGSIKLANIIRFVFSIISFYLILMIIYFVDFCHLYLAMKPQTAES